MLSAELSRRGVIRIQVLPRNTEDEDLLSEWVEDPTRRSRETYFKSIFVAKHLLEGIEERGLVDVRTAKRVVQSIVDLLLEDEATMRSLTALREFDASLFRHCVNVTILAVLIGRRIGLS